MSRIDALPADQRSVLQLLLRQGKGYDDLSGLLNLHAGEVRSRAYDALDAIGPGAAGLPSDRRQAIADWLLGQQAPDKASETRSFVEGSPAGRAWASAVADELRPLAGDRLPEVPLDGASGPTAPPAEPPTVAVESTPFAPAPGPAPRVSRRGGAILIGAVAAAIVAVVLVIVLTGDDDKPNNAAASTTTTAAQTTVKAHANLVPPKGAPESQAAAIVQFADANGQGVVTAVSQGLPNTSKAAYGIWAYTSPTVARLIGMFDKTDNEGHLVHQGALPQDVTDVTRYKEVLVTRETTGSPTKPGTIYLRGPMQAGASSG